MDSATPIGIVIAFAAIFGSMVMEGGNPAAIISPPAMMLVLLGTFGAAMASGLLKDATGMVSVMKGAMMAKTHTADEVITQVVGFAEKARREGLLALEEAAKDIDDPFLKKGIELAVDGTDPEELRDILENEIASMKSRHKGSAKFFEAMGGYSPTLGIIGTVLGLVHVLENLSDPSKLGHLIAGAFVATLWGVMSANIMFLPFGKRIMAVAGNEAARMELVIEGVLAIQAGANPRVVATKLRSKMQPPGPGVVKEAA